MNFDELTQFLEKRMKLPLPGIHAHDKMKPKMANGVPFKIQHPIPPKKGAVLILLYEEEGTIHFPLIQRANYEGIHGGQMALPGGGYEPTDKDQIDTALRESYEEIGIEPQQVDVVGTLSEFFVAVSNYMVLPVIGKTHEKPCFVPEPNEVEDIVTPPVAHLTDPSRQREKEMIVRNRLQMICPYFDLEGRTVWGATAMMLAELADVLREFHN